MAGLTHPHDWALILAGGRGQRMQHLTKTATGVSVPKQFCSLGRGPSLLHQALLRARTVAPPQRILITVTESHRDWWRSLRDCLPAQNILVQAEQRGTGIGILHPLLEILARDPDASLVTLPSDHFFRDETAIAAGLREALRLTRVHPRQVLLLGLEVEDADPDLGYMLPGEDCGEALVSVREFIEKPGAQQVQGLLRQGALCNSFIVAAKASALLGLFERHFPAAVAQLRDVIVTPRALAARRRELDRVFAAIPTIDFSSQIIAAEPEALAILRLAPCGWSDLGTPARLQRVLHRHGAVIADAPSAPPSARGQLDLAERAGA